MTKIDAPYLVTLDWDEVCAVIAIIAVFLQRVDDPLMMSERPMQALQRAQTKLYRTVRPDRATM